MNMSHHERKRGLRKKLIWATLMVGILPVILGLVLTYLKGTEELLRALGANFAGLAQEAANKTDLLIGQEIEGLQRFAALPETLQAVSEANRIYADSSAPAIKERMRQSAQDWKAARENKTTRHPVLGHLLGPYLANLSKFDEEPGAEVALYLTDRRGLLVSSVNTFPPFDSSDSPGWKKSFSAGAGSAYISDIYRPEGSPSFLFDIGVPVLDPSTGRPMGVLTLINNVKEYFKTPIHEIRFGDTGHAMLLDGNGDVLICPILPTGMHVTDPVLVEAVTGPATDWKVVKNDAHGGENSIVGFSPVRRVNHILAQSQSKAWFGFTRQDPKELYGPIRALLTYASAASVILLGLLVLLALAVSKRFVQPIHLLHEGTELIGKGNLSHRLQIRTHDEIEQLADEFNRMAANLQDSYTGLEQRVADRTKELTGVNIIAQTVNQSLDIQEILDASLNKILEVMGIEAGGIHLWDDTAQKLYLKSYRGIPDGVVQAASELGAGDHIAGKVAELGEPLRVEGPGLKEYAQAPLVRAGFQSIVSIPINSKNRLVATLTIASMIPRQFNPSDLQLLSSIGNQMGTAIDNATLYEREKMMVERLKEIDRFKSEFLSNVSHELRLPLTSIIGFSELLLDRIPGDLTPDQEDYIRNMQESGHHLLEIINNLLNLTKLRAGKMEVHYQRFELPVLIETVKRTVTPLVVKKGLHLESRIETGSPLIYTDEGKIKQILLNLLSNAIKFTPVGGRISIGARQTRLDGDPAVEIGVSDTGIGIRPQDKARIFEEFQQVDSTFTRDYSGTGLGLTISRQFMGLIGGRIEVESEPNRGSTFTITFPIQAGRVREQPVAVEPRVEPSLGTGRPMSVEPESIPIQTAAGLQGAASSLPRILVVEDDPTVARLLTLYLAQEGYHVDQAVDGEEAITKARRLQPFAITLDIMLPRRDGWEVLQKLKQLPETKDIPVIIISIIENRELGFSLGATDYFSKPIDRKALLESLKKLSLSTKIARKPVTILVIDDDEKILQLISAILTNEGYGILKSQRAQDGIDLAIEVQPDLILLDLLMPDVDGFEALERLKVHPTARNIPVIIFTARTLTEDDQNRLNTKIRGVIPKGRPLRESLLAEIRKFEKLYPDKARMVDGLTGFYNERYLNNRLADEVNRALRVRKNFSLIMTNLDGFQAFNKQYGVEAGNEVIRQAADLFRNHTRAANPICRCGGTTFAILLTETPKASAVLVGEKLREAIQKHAFGVEAPSRQNEDRHAMTISVGVATFFDDAETPEQLIVQATRALDAARAEGGNRVVARPETPRKAPPSEGA